MNSKSKFWESPKEGSPLEPISDNVVNIIELFKVLSAEEKVNAKRLLTKEKIF
jgi:hypothetical protein